MNHDELHPRIRVGVPPTPHEDDPAQYFLTNQGIYALRRVKESDMENLAKATGASIINNLDELGEDLRED